MGCTTALQPHGSWVVRQDAHSMGHGLYDTTLTHGSWVVRQYSSSMICGSYDTTLTHGSWVVQQDTHPEGHGLYDTTLIHGSWVIQRCAFPCTMGCMVVYFPMGHGLHNSVPSQHTMSHTTVGPPCAPCIMQHTEINRHPITINCTMGSDTFYNTSRLAQTTTFCSFWCSGSCWSSSPWLGYLSLPFFSSGLAFLPFHSSYK